MKRFAGLFMAACMAVAVPTAAVFADEVATESVEASSEAPEETSAETQAFETVAQELNIAQSLDGVELPANSEQITYTYHGNVCNAAKTGTGLYLLPVVQDDSSVVWYVYNEELDQAIPYVAFTAVNTSYAIVLPGADVTVPSGYESVSIDMNGRVVPAWFNSAAGDSNMYLIYAVGSDGSAGFYRFDGTNGACLRYVADPDVDLQASASSMSAELSSLQDSYNSMSSQDSAEIERMSNSANLQQQNYNNLKDNVKKYGLIGVAALGVVTFLMLIFFIRMISKSSKLKKAKKRVNELENAARARARQARQRTSEPSSRRVRRDDLSDTRMTEGREEGTSRVRRVPKNVNRDFDRSTTTSKVTRVSRAQAEDRSGSRPVRQPETTAPRQQRPAKSTDTQTRVQRPAKSTASRPSDETKIFDKVPVEEDTAHVRDLDGLNNKKSTPAESDSATVDIDMISEQLDSLHAVESSPVEDDLIEVESIDPEFYVDNSDDDDDFALTDFKDI